MIAGFRWYPPDRWLELIKWGTVGEWAAAVAAAAVIGFTLSIWLADRRREARRSILAEAAKVNAWYEGPRTNDAEIGAWTLVVANAGASAIYEWTAAVWWTRTGPSGGGTHWETRVLDGVNQGPLAPGDRRKLRIDLHDAHHGDVFPDHPMNDLRVSITWRDPTGDRWWIRYGSSLLDQAERFPEPWNVRGEPQAAPDLDRLAARAVPGLGRRSRTQR